MTKIIKLETKGFKSFANKTEIEYGDGFNVILGPNGSGKSNVLDALCFVLGKSGAKGLRAEKSANLIYNGGKSKTPAKQGEVHLYLDNNKKVFPVNAKVVKVSRVIKGSGTSVYMINDEKRTREQILELLSNAAIDPNGYNIILQGDIVRMVEMSTVDRRGTIEEIAGISVYEDKKKKAMNELDKIEKNLNEAEIILQERNSYLKELRKERDQAVAFKELTEKVKSLKATMVHVEIESRTKNIKEINDKAKVYVDKIKVIEKEIVALKKNVENYKKDLEKINKEIEEKGEKNQVQIHKEVEALRVDLATQKANIEGFQNEISRVKSQKEQLNNSLKEIQIQISGFGGGEKEQIKALSENKKLQTDLEKKIADFKKKNKLEGGAEIDNQITEIDSKAETLEKAVFEVRGQQQDLIREKDRLEVQIANADERIDKVMSVSKENKAEVERLKEMKKQFKSAVSDLQKCLTADASFASQVTNARGKIESLNQEMAKFRVRQATMSEMLGSNQAAKAIMDNKDQFGGVFGPVSELGQVEKKYAVALDTAAGARLRSIVVKDDKVAAQCIKFLKDKRLGTCTFLPLNKIKGPAAKDLSGKGVVGSAIKLVKFDPKFKPVFSYVFGGTVVVESIEVARRIGIGTAKMVTLDGDVAEMSGAMKGGFSKRRAGAGFQESKGDDEAKTEKQLADAQSMLSKLESDRKSNQDQIDRLRELKANLEGDVIRIEKSLHLDSDDLEISKKLKEEFGVKLKKVDTDLDKISAEVSTKNRELANLKIERQKLRAQIMSMRNPTKLAELNTFEQKLQSVKSENY